MNVGLLSKFTKFNKIPTLFVLGQWFLPDTWRLVGIWVRFHVPTNVLELSRVTTPLNLWCFWQKRKSIAPSNLDGWQCICKLPLHTGFADCHHLEKTLALERPGLTALVRLCAWSFDTADRYWTWEFSNSLLLFSNHSFFVWCDYPFFWCKSHKFQTN